MDQENAVVEQQTRIPPAMLEEFAADPKAAGALTRKLYLVQLDQMHRRMRDPNAPLAAKQAFIEHLAKIGDIVPKPAAAGAAQGAGFSVNIIFDKTPSKAPTMVIEANPPAAPADTPTGIVTDAPEVGDTGDIE